MKRACYNVHYLEDADISNWASMEYWRNEEAIFLSLGITPDKDGPENSDEDALRIGYEYGIRDEMLCRNRQLSKKLTSVAIPSFEQQSDGSYLQDGEEIAYHPREFVEWAVENFPSFPAKLSCAVLRTRPLPTTCKSNAESGRKVPTNATDGEPKSLIAHRWAPKRELEAKARDFVREQLTSGCKCNHIMLAEYMFEAHDDNGLLFKHPKIDDKKMGNLLRKAVKAVFQEEVPNRIPGTASYSKPDQSCPLHSK